MRMKMKRRRQRRQRLQRLQRLIASGRAQRSTRAAMSLGLTHAAHPNLFHRPRETAPLTVFLLDKRVSDTLL